MPRSVSVNVNVGVTENVLTVKGKVEHTVYGTVVLYCTFYIPWIVVDSKLLPSPWVLASSCLI